MFNNKKPPIYFNSSKFNDGLMKRMVIVFTFCLVIFAAKAQSPNANIEKQFLNYSKLMIDKNYEKALDYTDEEFFKIVPKEQLIALLTKTLNPADMEYKAGMPTLSDFQPVKTINNKSYIKFISHTTLQIKFNEDKEDKLKTDEEKKRTRVLQETAFKTQFGAENVSFDEATGYFKLKSHKNVIASSNDKMADWKFVIVENDRQKKILERFIPAEVLD